MANINAELFFTDTLWPDFTPRELEQIIAQFIDEIEDLGVFSLVGEYLKYLYWSSYWLILNVLIYRIPKGENIAFPASHCQSCSTPSKWWHKYPQLYPWGLYLGGKMATFVREDIYSIPNIEFLTGG